MRNRYIVVRKFFGNRMKDGDCIHKSVKYKSVAFLKYRLIVERILSYVNEPIEKIKF